MKIQFLTALFLLLLPPSLTVSNDKAIRNEVNAKVSQLVELLRDSCAQEDRDVRGIQILKNREDNTVTAVAIFTIEGFGHANNDTQFMAAFENMSKKSEGNPPKLSLLDVIAVGGKGMRYIDSNNIRMKKSQDGIVIMLSTWEYGPDDGLCCPSIKSKTRFIIARDGWGRLQEITKQKAAKN